MTIKRAVRTVLCLILLVAVTALPALAASGPGFQVEPILPENQRNRVGYFDLLVNPGQMQELILLVQNNSDEALEVEMELVNASTVPDGFIDYTIPGVRDSSMTYAFEDLAELDETRLTIPAGGEEAVKITVQVPAENFPGMILGGVKVLKINSEDSGALINNRYQYAVAVALTTDETPVAPDLELVGVDAALDNNYAAIIASIRNREPAPLKRADVYTEITLEGTEGPVFTMNKNIDIAPHSVWDCTLLDQAGYGLQAGDYRFYMTIDNDDGHWEFEEAFTVSSREAQSINQNAVNQQQPAAAARGTAFPTWAIILCIVGALLLLLFLLLFFIRRRKEDDEDGIGHHGGGSRD